MPFSATNRPFAGKVYVKCKKKKAVRIVRALGLRNHRYRITYTLGRFLAHASSAGEPNAGSMAYCRMMKLDKVVIDGRRSGDLSLHRITTPINPD